MIKFEVEGRPMSWNIAHSGRHWAVRMKMNDQMKWRVKAALMKYRVPRKPITQSVRILFVAYVGRPIDCDNIMLKTYIDGMREWGLLPDDSPKWVTEINVKVITKNSTREWMEVIVDTELENL